MTEKSFRGLGPIEFEGVSGVGTMKVDFEPGHQVYALIGENGVGKTKFLECLFTNWLFTYKENFYDQFAEGIGYPYGQINKKTLDNIGILDFIVYKIDKYEIKKTANSDKEYINLSDLAANIVITPYQNNIPFVYLAANERGIIRNYDSSKQGKNNLGTWEERRHKYLENLFEIFFSKYLKDKLKELSMNNAINKWLVLRAQSANPNQSQEDNREIEIKVLLNLLHQIDERIDPDFLEIDSANNIGIKIDGEKRQIFELSSGFTSLLKIVQSIIAGYGYLTNAQDLANVPGIVLIDEIESHLHGSWQLKIMPLLKRLFPKTTFVVTTHSPLIISSLAEGEAYRLQREEDGTVHGSKILRPNQMPLIDLLKEGFDISINEAKLGRLAENDQREVKDELLRWVKEELAAMGKKS